MAYIKVDHSKLEATAVEVENYVSFLKDKMKNVQGEGAALSSSWQGSDFSHFKSQLDQLDDADSTHTQMIKALESYAKYLRYAAEKYKNAQSKAINAANSLPKY